MSRKVVAVCFLLLPPLVAGADAAIDNLEADDALLLQVRAQSPQMALTTHLKMTEEPSGLNEGGGSKDPPIKVPTAQITIKNVCTKLVTGFLKCLEEWKSCSLEVWNQMCADVEANTKRCSNAVVDFFFQSFWDHLTNLKYWEKKMENMDEEMKSLKKGRCRDSARVKTVKHIDGTCKVWAEELNATAKSGFFGENTEEDKFLLPIYKSVQDHDCHEKIGSVLVKLVTVFVTTQKDCMKKANNDEVVDEASLGDAGDSDGGIYGDDPYGDVHWGDELLLQSDDRIRIEDEIQAELELAVDRKSCGSPKNCKPRRVR